MATYYDAAFDLATASASGDQQYDMVHPWWDLVSTMSLQFTMIIALTSISLDVFNQFGSGIKCTPYNGTIHIPLQQVGQLAWLESPNFNTGQK